MDCKKNGIASNLQIKILKYRETKSCNQRHIARRQQNWNLPNDSKWQPCLLWCFHLDTPEKEPVGQGEHHDGGPLGGTRKRKVDRDFRGVQRLRLWAPNAGGMGSIPGWGTKIPHATPIKNKQGRSQDGVLGGRRIRISSQLGHLPGTGGGPWTPKGTGGTPSDWVGCGVWG